MYQLEVKAALIALRFPRSEGWRVTVDVDPMELGQGPQTQEKRERCRVAEQSLRELGVKFGAHEAFGRADIVAEHEAHGITVVEVEGDSSRQREQALYSALGQILLVMRRFDAEIRYAIATPGCSAWRTQLEKIPAAAAARLKLQLLAVSHDSVVEVTPISE
jgi:hypothetical protein